MKLICCYVLATALVFAQASPDVELKAAMHQEEVLGDLKGAIAAYSKITEKYPKNRAIVARAMIQMAQCHEKLGRVPPPLVRSLAERHRQRPG